MSADSLLVEFAPPPRTPEPTPRAPLPRGERNENPGVPIVQLLVEDWRTHDSSFIAPGFWAIAVHRFGNWRMDLPRPARAPFTAAYNAMSLAVSWGFGIDIGYTVKLGRRVRIWHHGGMVIGARSIGDDVTLRQNTTLGVLTKSDRTAKPTIESGVDIGAGACILGDVTVGRNSVIGANTVVTRDVPAGSTMLGVPARPVRL